jgi:hypothetical protein
MYTIMQMSEVYRLNNASLSENKALVRRRVHIVLSLLDTRKIHEGLM